MILLRPIILSGDGKISYRDPAVVYARGVYHMYFTYVDNVDGHSYLCVGEVISEDLERWSQLRLLTDRDTRLNYSSPGNVVCDDDEWVLCIQSYSRENGETYGNERSRLFTMRSRDLINWSEPELMRVKGPRVKREDMGRMIDPYLIRARGEWWCFYKQNGVSFSKSPDLKTWTYIGRADAGENACVIEIPGGYRMFSSPENGIRVMDSVDLTHWERKGQDIVLGQSQWEWAKGRLTAGFVMETPRGSGLKRYAMFFHGSKYKDIEAFSSIAVAFSDDLYNWSW